MLISSESVVGKWGDFADLRKFAACELQDGYFSVQIDTGCFECLFSGSPHKRLFILLSGARNPATHPLPKFSRRSWRKMFPGAVLWISDPTIYLHPDLLPTGWYVGTSRHNWLHSMAVLAGNVADRLAISHNQIICYGSAAGGFGALTLAAELGDATAVAINPQTVVENNSLRFVKQFLHSAFDGRKPSDLTADERARLSALDAVERAPNVRCLIAQNLQDVTRYADHYKPFCLRFGLPLDGGSDESGRLRSFIFDSDRANGVEPKELARELIVSATALSGSCRTVLRNPRRFSVPRITKRPRINSAQLYLRPEGALAVEVGADEKFVFNAAGRSDLPKFEIKLPVDWNIDPFEDRNWCAQLHMWRMMDANLVRHSETLDLVYLDFPLKIIEDWHRFHYVEKRKSRFAWKDMMVGLRAMKLAYVISQLWHDSGQLSPKWQVIFDDLMTDHIGFLTDHNHVSYFNHTFIDLHGAAALAQVAATEDAIIIEAFIDEVLPKLLAVQVNEDGVHLEHSPGYQPFLIGCLTRLLNSRWFERFNFVDLVKKAEGVWGWFVLPDGRTIPFGDTTGARQHPEVHETAYSGGRQIFNSTGYVVVRDDGGGEVKKSSLCAVTGTFYCKYHKQADDLSFIWFEGEDILCDAGKFAYNADPRRDYVLSARAHNTVEIDNDSYGAGRGEDPTNIYGSAIGDVVTHEWGYLIDAHVWHRKIGVQHSRFIAFCPGGWLLVIDRLSSDVSHEFTQWFHFSPHLPDLSKQADGYQTCLSNGRSLHIRSVGNGTVTDVMEKGATQPRLQGWISQSYRELVPNCALGYGQQGQRVMFATLLSLDDTGSQVVMQDGTKINLKLSRNGEVSSFQFLIGETACQVL